MRTGWTAGDSPARTAIGRGSRRTNFWCQQCARLDGVDGVFHELRDRKTGECVEREQVRLLVARGPYDRDLDGRSQA
ncbi:hypothetical protein [Haloplanus aerogenes]|uniref:hypothetical protein n=1 Tax=Haloplanus aerogenes TaxID=660522 RepID=UPI001F54234B|nr:hypothetical protein [Haloplanus aerogenes]